MPLKSVTFADDERLQACLVNDSAHLTLNTEGEFVAKVQTALIYLDNLKIDQTELDAQKYGRSTADAVLSFKRKRKIINHSYQTTEDEIVGKMTIKALDDELVKAEGEAVDLSISPFCIERI